VPDFAPADEVGDGTLHAVASRAHTAVDNTRLLTDFMDPPNVAWGGIGTIPASLEPIRRKNLNRTATSLDECLPRKSRISRGHAPTRWFT
jgi:hypothetical protein